MAWRNNLWLLACIGYCWFFTGCEGGVDDPSFDLWCDGALCRWQVHEGEIERTATWHARDYGVALLGETTSLYQDRPEFYSDCIDFEFVADVQPSATVMLELDFNIDGAVDYTQELQLRSWEPEHLYVSAPRIYKGVRFWIRKEGAGRAVLGTMQAHTSSLGECGSEPLAVSNLADGLPCEEDAECQAGRCTAGHYCGGCAGDEECEDGSLCLRATHSSEQTMPAPMNPVQRNWRQCQDAALRPTDLPTLELCTSELECRSGACIDWPRFGGWLGEAGPRCGPCTTDDQCPAGEVCQSSYVAAVVVELLASSIDVATITSTCGAPGEAGTVCESDADCAGWCCPEEPLALLCEADQADQADACHYTGLVCQDEAPCP